LATFNASYLFARLLKKAHALQNLLEEELHPLSRQFSMNFDLAQSATLSALFIFS
jgi:hypothetical protein